MRILAIIPARGGSKGIPKKNIVPLAGRPLLAYSAEAALTSHRITRAILSTDDAEIAAVGRTVGLEVPFLRPAEFARDDSPAIDVVRHALDYFESSEGWAPDAVMLLQPTSPLRRREHVDGAVQLLEETGADSVVSVIPVPHQFTPTSLMQVQEGRLVPLVGGTPLTRRQDKPQLFARNGPAIVLTRCEVIRSNRLYGDDCRPFPMDPHDSIDIDAPADLTFAEYLLARRRAA